MVFLYFLYGCYSFFIFPSAVCLGCIVVVIIICPILWMGCGGLFFSLVTCSVCACHGVCGFPISFVCVDMSPDLCCRGVSSTPVWGDRWFFGSSGEYGGETNLRELIDAF